MLFSELGREWRPIPPWVRFLIDVGYRWPSKGARRRIALITMPGDSAAAGVTTLGCVVRDLSDPLANDVDSHYEHLLRYAKQYLNSCHKCDLPTCQPEIKRCGYTLEATGRLKSPLFPHKTFTVSDKTDFEKKRIAWVYPSGLIQWPTPQYAVNWHIEGEAPPELNTANGELATAPYEGLVEGAHIDPQNLRKSYSGLCLAGRVRGENATRDACASVRFRGEEHEYRLEELLTVYGWSTAIISRLSFLNTRTGVLNTRFSTPSLVVADGDVSFLKLLGSAEFQRSDVIGIIPRTLERTALESIGVRMQELRQWYDPDDDFVACVEPPRGVSIAVLVRK